MAYLSLSTITEAWSNLPHKVRCYNESEAVTNNHWNIIHMVIPSDFKDAWLARIMVRTNGAATHHPAVAIETCTFRHLRGGQNRATDSIFPGHIQQTSSGTGTAANEWCQQYEYPLLEPILPGDIFEIVAPPADDDGSVTGSYEVELLFTHIRY